MRTLFASVFLVLVGSAILAGQVARIPAVPRRPPKETLVYLVTFRRDIPASQRPAVVQASGARLRRTFVAVNAVSVEIPDTAVMARLRNDPRIVSVIEDRRISLFGLKGVAEALEELSQRRQRTLAPQQFLRVRLTLPGRTTPTMKLDSR